MSEETKKEIKQECFCKSELFQRTLAVAIGSFIGLFCAMNLFFALHKPPMMMYHHHHHQFKQKMFNNNMMPQPMPGFDYNKMKNFKDMKNIGENKD